MADESVKSSSSEDVVQVKNIKNTEPKAEAGESVAIENFLVQHDENVNDESGIINEENENINDEESERANEEESEKVPEDANEEEEEELSDELKQELEEEMRKKYANCIKPVEIKFSEEEIAAKNKVAEAIRTFTHNIHKSIANETKGNFVCSGLSAHSVLAMAAQGAEGVTAEIMQHALSLPENQQQTCMGYQCYIKNMNNAHKMVFKLANKVYVSSKKELKEKFKDTTATYFNSESELVDFSERKAAAEKINDWCGKTTDGKIRNIISERDLGGNVNFLLLNALYFKGVWNKKFLHTLTTTKPYHVDKNTIKEVPMMYNKTYYYYNELEDESAHFIGIPYQNDNYCMFIIVPKEIDGLANVEKNYELVRKAFDTVEHRRRISLFLPRFKITSTINLQPYLCQMGMKGIFDADADFNGITNQSGGTASVRQKVFIEVNEDGTESLCFTDFLKKVKYDHNVPLELTVDRPFLYQIYDKTNGIPLFSGRIIDPSTEDNCCD